MPRIVIMMKPGRTAEQHRALVKEVTTAVTSTLDVPPDTVNVVLAELHDHLVASGGVIASDQTGP